MHCLNNSKLQLSFVPMVIFMNEGCMEKGRWGELKKWKLNLFNLCIPCLGVLYVLWLVIICISCFFLCSSLTLHEIEHCIPCFALMTMYGRLIYFTTNLAPPSRIPSPKVDKICGIRESNKDVVACIWVDILTVEQVM